MLQSLEKLIDGATEPCEVNIPAGTRRKSGTVVTRLKQTGSALGCQLLAVLKK